MSKLSSKGLGQQYIVLGVVLFINFFLLTPKTHSLALLSFPGRPSGYSFFSLFEN